MDAVPVVSLAPQEATDILTALAMFGGLLLGDLIQDEELPNGALKRLGVDPGPGAARRLHARTEHLVQAIRRDLDRLA